MFIYSPINFIREPTHIRKGDAQWCWFFLPSLAGRKSCHAWISLGSKFPRVTCYLLQIRRTHTTEAKLKANQKQGFLKKVEHLILLQ